MDKLTLSFRYPTREVIRALWPAPLFQKSTCVTINSDTITSGYGTAIHFNLIIIGYIPLITKYMKIIQSFWSKPSFHSMQNYTNARRFGGWLNFRYFMISTALSCLTIRKHQGNIDLVTDDNGKGLFIDLME